MGITKAKNVTEKAGLYFFGLASVFSAVCWKMTLICVFHIPLTYSVATSMVSLGVVSTVVYREGFTLD